MKILVKKTIVLLIFVVSVSPYVANGESESKKLGRWTGSSTCTEAHACPGGGSWSETVSQNFYEGGTVTQKSATNCDGSTMDFPAETLYYAIGPGGSSSSWFMPTWDDDYLYVNFGDPSDLGAPKVSPVRSIDAKYSRAIRYDFGTDDVNVRIFEAINNGEDVVVVLDTMVSANVSGRIPLKDYNINENYYISVSRGVDFTSMQNAVYGDKVSKMIADYNTANSNESLGELRNGRYKSCFFTSRLVDICDKKSSPFENATITVYPNPSRNDVNVNVSAELSGDLKVYYVNRDNNEYELVYTIGLEDGVTSYKVDSSVLSRNGVYMLVGEVTQAGLPCVVNPVPIMIVE